jgi:hypothetical protein
MSEDSLSRLVAGLRSELAQAHDLNPDTREALHELAREVETALRSPPSSQSAARSIGDRLSDRVREVEVSHPRLSMTIGNLVDTLAFYGL